MITRLTRSGIGICAIALAAPLIFATATFAQRGGRGGGGAPPVITPQDVTDYNNWTRIQDPDKKLQAGLQFVHNYPTSQYNETVYDSVSLAYYAKQDWTNFFTVADQAIGKHPDDFNILIRVGWIIPHIYNPDDADGGKKLDKAESYEEHAIEVLGALVKPSNLTDDQFSASKNDLLSQAHSGLGLVYFRRQDYDNSVKELQQATQLATNQDPADLYALGVGLVKGSHFSDAADAFTKCAAISGSLQSVCQQQAAQAKSQAPH